MLLALTDLLGGFLHHAVLPMARKAFYAGAVDYAYMEKLIQLYEELKWFLRTNGQGWTKPMRVNKEVKVPIIDMDTLNHPKTANESCCQKLMYYEHEPIRTQKRSVNLEKGLYFPLPFFDARSKPTAIALPLKHFALRNIESKRAAYVVMKYFITAERCFKEKNAKKDLIQRFQNNLYTWIDKDVIPKLHDDKFYSAFGGIVRVQNTLRALGARLGNKPCVSDEGDEEVGAIPGVGCTSNRNKLLLIAMLVIIVAWFLIGTCFICYRMRNNRLKSQDNDDKDSKGTETSSSPSSSKWSSMVSKSSSKTDKPLCKCCESISEKSTPGLSSTSESERSKRKERRGSKSFKTNRKSSLSSPCVCIPGDKTAILDTNNSMKMLPSIAEISEHSLQKDKNGSFRRISFAMDESSSDNGPRICAPPWAQTKNTVPCPALSGKNGGYSTSLSTTSKSQPPDGGPTMEDNQQSQSRSGEMPKDSSLILPTYNTTFKNESSITSQDMSADDKPQAVTSTSGTAEEFQDDSETVIKTQPDQVNQIEIQDGKGGSNNDNPGNAVYDFHSACHSNMAGTYDLYRRTGPNKSYIFGYDFQTSSSSELSDEYDYKN